jgi:hypothetical protein
MNLPAYLVVYSVYNSKTPICAWSALILSRIADILTVQLVVKELSPWKGYTRSV